MSAAPSDCRPAPSGAAPAPAVGSQVREEPFDPTDLLTRIWKQNVPLMQARLLSLEQAAQQAQAGQLTPDGRTYASDLAHKFAGAAGMFGYPRGTEIARDMENMLEADGEPDPDRFIQLVADLRAVLPL